MRAPTDICLLCDERNSTKENSHLVPKFMSKSILGEGKFRRAYVLDTNRADLPAPFVQDTPKESFLFCPQCESYFSILETYMAQRLHNRLWDIRKVDQFPLQRNEADVTWKICKEINSSIFHLFIYSIVWRCSVSSAVLYKNFKLYPEEEALLKNNLKLFLSISQKELLDKIDSSLNEVQVTPFIIYTCDSFANRSSNTLHANPNARNPYALYLSEYILFISFGPSEEFDKLRILVNRDLDFIKIGFFNEKFWEEQKKRFLSMIVKISHDKLKASGKKAYAGG